MALKFWRAETHRFFVHLLVTLVMAAGIFASATIAEGADTGSLIIRMAEGLSTDQQAAVIARNGGTKTSSIPALRMYVISVADAELPLVQQNYQADAQVVCVEMNKTRKAEGMPNDISYPVEWALSKIGWDSVFGTITPAGSATVAILDTGVDASHPDLGGNVIEGASMLVDGANGQIDSNGHGTNMAGIVAALTDNEIGLAGVAFAGVRIMPVTVLDEGGIGLDSDIIAGIVWAADQGADVILMAFSNPDFSQSLQDAIDYAWEKGSVLVSAVGNAGVGTPTFPAGDRGVIGVSGTDESDLLVSGSNTGQDVFLAAPGSNMYTTSLEGSYTYLTGTSTSSAVVAGVAAFMKAVDQSLTNGVIVGRLARSADAIGTEGDPDNRLMFGNGRVNMARALADTGTDSVQPAGATPVGEGGPYVGPYLVAGKAVINGTVSGGGVGIAGATVTCTSGCNGSPSGTTDSTGEYSFQINFSKQAYNITLEVSAPGYIPSSRADVTSSPQEFILTPIGKLSQDIAFPNLSEKTYGDPAFTVSAVASSGLDVSFVSLTEEKCITGGPNGGTVGIVAAGDCTIRASQSGDSAYDPAEHVDRTFAVNKAAASVTPAAGSKTYGTVDPAFIGELTGFLTADGVTAAYSRAEGDNVATYQISATLSATGALANYHITYNTADFTILKASQTITVTSPAPSSAGYKGTFIVAASAPLPVDITTSGACSGSGIGTATITMSSSTGTCTVSYDQSGDGNYNPASKVESSTMAQKGTPLVTAWPTASSLAYGQALSVSTLSGGVVEPDGSFAFTTPDAIPNAGTALQNVTFTPADTTNYNSVNDNVSVSVTLACGAPSQITVPAVNTTGSVYVSWGASNISGVTYVLEYSKDGASWTQAYSGIGKAYNFTAANGNYDFRVKANKSGYADSGYTEGANVCAVALACGAPSQITVPAGSTTGSVYVSWGVSNISGVTYVLEYSKDGASWTQAYSGIGTAYNFTAANGNYHFQVKAKKLGYADSGWKVSSSVTVTRE